MAGSGSFLTAVIEFLLSGYEGVGFLFNLPSGLQHSIRNVIILIRLSRG